MTKASADDASNFQEQQGASYPILSEAGANWGPYAVGSLPATFLLDANNAIVARGLEESLAEIEARLGS